MKTDPIALIILLTVKACGPEFTEAPAPPPPPVVAPPGGFVPPPADTVVVAAPSPAPVDAGTDAPSPATCVNVICPIGYACLVENGATKCELNVPPCVNACCAPDGDRWLVSQGGSIAVDKMNGWRLWARDQIPAGSWVDADAACSSLVLEGVTGWRLPTVDEAKSMIDINVYAVNADGGMEACLPAVDPAVFAWPNPNNKSMETWASEPCVSMGYAAHVCVFQGLPLVFWQNPTSKLACVPDFNGLRPARCFHDPMP